MNQLRNFDGEQAEKFDDDFCSSTCPLQMKMLSEFSSAGVLKNEKSCDGVSNFQEDCEKRRKIISRTDSEYDWQSTKSLVEANLFMYLNQVDCDVTFAIGDSEVSLVRAHRYILISRSPVFFAMLSRSTPLAENCKDEDPIEIPDIDICTFKALLRYMYSEETRLDEENALKLLYAAKKYLLLLLVDRCRKFLQESLDANNVGIIYEQSMAYDEEELAEKCKKFIVARTAEVVGSDGFLNVRHSTLLNVVAEDVLCTSELKLFQAVLRWAARECSRQGLDGREPANQRLVIGDALYLLRFPTLSISQFSASVCKAGILTSEEKCSIFEYIADSETEIESSPATQKSFPKMLFPLVCRRRPQPLTLCRFSSFCRYNIYSGDCAIMKISCDHPVLLKGFGISGSLTYDPLSEVQITIRQDKTMICNELISVSDDRTDALIPVMFPETVLLSAHVRSTIIVTFHFYGDCDQGNCRRGKGGFNCLQCDGVTFEFDRSDSAGLVHEIYFCRA